MELNPIAISLSPNVQIDDFWVTLKELFKPRSWKSGQSIKDVEAWFRNYLNNFYVYSFSSGRYALYAVLKAFGISKGDEVILQAFTCVAVVDPIVWVGAKPIFSDTDETLNINPKSLEKLISSKTKAIIVQHTFGIPANLKLIKKIVHKHNLILIEDCAHSLGARINNAKVGTMGDAAIFSFGRDKIISSVFGGLAAIASKFKLQNSQLQLIHNNLEFPTYYWIFQQLLHPVIMSLILPVYNIGIGKIILYILQKLNLLSKPIDEIEKYGGKPSIYTTKYPNALAFILMNQLEKLDIYNSKRRRIARFYFSGLKKLNTVQLPPDIKGAIYLRFNLLYKNAQELLIKAKKNKIILGSWYSNTIDPDGVKFAKVGYQKGSCPKAEKYALNSLNLPTYPRLRLNQLKKILKFITANIYT